MDKYYYGITLRNRTSYCVESNIDNIRDFMHMKVNGTWLEFKGETKWTDAQTNEELEFNSVIVRVEDIISVCFLSDKDAEDINRKI